MSTTAAETLRTFQASVNECFEEAIDHVNRGDLEAAAAVLGEALRLAGMALASVKTRGLLGAMFGRRG